MDSYHQIIVYLHREGSRPEAVKVEMRRNLVIVSPGFPADENDSTCLPSQQLLVRAINRIFPNITVTIISLHYPYHNDKYRWYGNLVIPLHQKRFLKIFRPFIWQRAHSTLTKLNTENKLDGILSFWCHEAALVGSRFSKKTIPHKIWICGQDARANNRLVKWIRPDANELVAMSDFLADEFERNHRIRPAHLVPNGVECIARAPIEQVRDIDILGVGSLIRLKQYDIFVNAVKELSKANGKLKIVLTGDGPERDNLMKKIRALQLQDNITLTGTLPHQEVLALARRAKIFLHPSAYEGFSTACLEALNARCKVISFTKPMREDIPNWHIIADVNEMIDVARSLLVTPQIYSPTAYHSIDDSAKKIINLLFGYSQ